MTREEALLQAVAPLRQADFAQVKETLRLINFPTRTAMTIKVVVANLLDYFQQEKDFSPPFELPPAVDPVKVHIANTPFPDIPKKVKK